GLHGSWRAFVEQETADRLELRENFPRLGAGRQIRVQDEGEPCVPTPCGVTQQGFVVRARKRGHARSPSCARSRASARRTRDFTVPSGIPKLSAISECE